MKFAEQRTDLSQTFEDFERVLEDYLHIIPPDSDFFLHEKASKWVYDDMQQSLTFYFDDAWLMDEFKDKLEHCPGKMYFKCEEFEHVDRENLTITVIGLKGGLI
jgi:hypothetical protein